MLHGEGDFVGVAGPVGVTGAAAGRVSVAGGVTVAGGVPVGDGATGGDGDCRAVGLGDGVGVAMHVHLGVGVGVGVGVFRHVHLGEGDVAGAGTPACAVAWIPLAPAVPLLAPAANAVPTPHSASTVTASANTSEPAAALAVHRVSGRAHERMVAPCMSGGSREPARYGTRDLVTLFRRFP